MKGAAWEILYTGLAAALFLAASSALSSRGTREAEGSLLCRAVRSRKSARAGFFGRMGPCR